MWECDGDQGHAHLIVMDMQVVLLWLEDGEHHNEHSKNRVERQNAQNFEYVINQIEFHCDYAQESSHQQDEEDSQTKAEFPKMADWQTEPLKESSPE